MEKQTDRILKLKNALRVFMTGVFLFLKSEVSHCYCCVPVNMKMLISSDFPPSSHEGLKMSRKM